MRDRAPRGGGPLSPAAKRLLPRRAPTGSGVVGVLVLGRPRADQRRDLHRDALGWPRGARPRSQGTIQRGPPRPDDTSLALREVRFRPWHAEALRAVRTRPFGSSGRRGCSSGSTTTTPTGSRPTSRSSSCSGTGGCSRTSCCPGADGGHRRSLRTARAGPASFPVIDMSRPLLVGELTLVGTDRFRPELLRPVREAFGDPVGRPAPPRLHQPGAGVAPPAPQRGRGLAALLSARGSSGCSWKTSRSRSRCADAGDLRARRAPRGGPDEHDVLPRGDARRRDRRPRVPEPQLLRAGLRDGAPLLAPSGRGARRRAPAGEGPLDLAFGRRRGRRCPACCPAPDTNVL